jgi:hypothetical protein
MSAVNDITGDKIQSRVLSKQGRENWDYIFKKQDAYVWVAELYPHLTIYDPDGWRRGDGVTMSTPITRADFESRLSESTCLGHVLQPIP